MDTNLTLSTHSLQYAPKTAKMEAADASMADEMETDDPLPEDASNETDDLLSEDAPRYHVYRFVSPLLASIWNPMLILQRAI